MQLDMFNGIGAPRFYGAFNWLWGTHNVYNVDIDISSKWIKRTQVPENIHMAIEYKFFTLFRKWLVNTYPLQLAQASHDCHWYCDNRVISLVPMK